MINAARAPTLHRVNEYFGVDVVSVAMDGVAPESQQDVALREK